MYISEREKKKLIRTKKNVVRKNVKTQRRGARQAGGSEISLTKRSIVYIKKNTCIIDKEKEKNNIIQNI